MNPDGYIVMWRADEGVYSYTLPGERGPYVASTPEELSEIATERIPDSGFMSIGVRYVVSTSYARREFLLDV